MEAARWRWLLTALLALGLGGCPGETPPCVGGFPSVAPVQQLVGVGQEVSLSVTADLSRACMEGGAVRAPESVTVQVYDPQNQTVPATATLPTGGATATLRFTPTVTGRHHVIVSFAPVGSLHQFGIHAMVSRDTERPMARLTFEPNCVFLDRTTSGTWICGPRALRDPAAPAQVLSPPNPSLPTFTAVAGDVVWVVERERVLRYVDRGTGDLELTGTAPFSDGTGNPSGSFYMGPHSRLATEAELVLLTDNFLHRYTFTEPEGLTVFPTTRWSSTSGSRPTTLGQEGIAGMLVRAGGRVLVVSRVSDFQTGGTQTQACPFQPGASGTFLAVSGEACHTLEGDPVGYEDGVLWMRVFNSNTGSALNSELLRRYTAASGRLEAQGELSMDGRLFMYPYLLRPGPSLPTVTASGTPGPHAAPIWNAEQGTVELELLPPTARDANSAPHVGQHFIWADSLAANGGVMVYPRQSTR